MIRLKTADAIAMMLSFTTLIFVLGPLWGTLEGRYFPVTEGTLMISSRIDPPPAHRSIWASSAYKIRQCDWKSTQWFVGPLDHGVPTKSDYAGPPRVNPEGQLYWDDLRIWAYPETVRDYSYAYVYHQCPGRWYQTKTLFFVGAPSDG